MSEHRALVVTIRAATRGQSNGASLRVGDVVAALSAASHAADLVQELPASGGPWCTAVVVSYAAAGKVRALRALAPRVWLDAMDSWLVVNGSGLRHAHPSFAARAARDGVRLLRMPPVDLVTYISAADRASDHATIRGGRRLVLPGQPQPPVVRDSPDRRAMLVGDWTYQANRDGLRWLARSVLPHLDGVVDVYGAGADQFHHPRLRMHGYIPGDDHLYQSGDVHLAPLRFGAGVKRKVLQPLLAGLPVVTTTPGARGLRPHPLLDVRDDPVQFAARVVERLAAAPVLAPPQPSALFDADDHDQVLAWLRSCRGLSQ